jgi:hypothetical protein
MIVFNQVKCDYRIYDPESFGCPEARATPIIRLPNLLALWICYLIVGFFSRISVFSLLNGAIAWHRIPIALNQDCACKLLSFLFFAAQAHFSSGHHVAGTKRRLDRGRRSSCAATLKATRA